MSAPRPPRGHQKVVEAVFGVRRSSLLTPASALQPFSGKFGEHRNCLRQGDRLFRIGRIPMDRTTANPGKNRGQPKQAEGGVKVPIPGKLDAPSRAVDLDDLVFCRDAPPISGRRRPGPA